MRALASCAVISVIVWAQPIARGDGVGVIASRDSFPASSAAEGRRSSIAEPRLANVLGDALAGRAPRIVPDAVAEARAALAAGAVPIATLAQFRRVRAQIDDGWRAYLQVSVDAAAVELAAARSDAEALLALPGGPELYADAALRLGAVLGHPRLARTAESRAAYALALALDPDRPVALAEFSPDIVDAVEAVRRERPALQRVRIATTPVGAQIAIDGQDAGRAPLDATLARGQHVVVARAPGAHPAVRGFAVDGDGAQIELALDPDPDAGRLGGVPLRGLADALAQGLVDIVLRYADLDELVIAVATTRRGGPTLLVQRCAGVPARCTAVVELGYGEPAGLAAAARAALAAAAAGELRYPPTVFGARDDRVIVDGGKCKPCRSPWLWTGVGAAVVAGAVIMLIATSGAKPAPVVGFDGSDF